MQFEVQLFTATKEARDFPLHQIDRNSGERIRYQLHVPGKGPVERADIVKGYEFEKGRYITFEPDELDKLKLESKQTLDLVQFIDRAELSPAYFDKSYYVTPTKSLSEEAFAVVRDAMQKTGKVAIGQITLSGKERIAALMPLGRGMELHTLRYPDEVRAPKEFFDELPESKAPADQLDLAAQLIQQKSAPFDPNKFRDRYDDAMRKLIEQKIGKRKPDADAPAVRPAGNVVNIMDALKKSLGVERARKAEPKRASGRGGRSKAA